MQTFSRGHETPEHRVLKPEVAALLRDMGFDPVLCEHEHCDVVAVRSNGKGVLGVEIERSKRNLLRNLTRNFARGCDDVLVVCPNFASAAEASRALARHLPACQQGKVALATISALRLLQPISDKQTTNTLNHENTAHEQ